MAKTCLSFSIAIQEALDQRAHRIIKSVSFEGKPSTESETLVENETLVDSGSISTLQSFDKDSPDVAEITRLGKEMFVLKQQEIAIETERSSAKAILNRLSRLFRHVSARTRTRLKATGPVHKVEYFEPGQLGVFFWELGVW